MKFDGLDGGRCNYDDGGSYIGTWQKGRAHGYGICIGPPGNGEYAGIFHYGFEVSGVHSWSSGHYYEGQWDNGKLHGLGVERRGQTTYMGEFCQGYKGRHGVRQSTVNRSRYEGTWSAGFHDGYGTETYVDGGTYQGQWLRGTRHGYGIRKSSSYGSAVKDRSRSRMTTSIISSQGEFSEEKSLSEELESRGGFVLQAAPNITQQSSRSLSDGCLAVKRTVLSGLRIYKRHSTGDVPPEANGTAGPRCNGTPANCCISDESGASASKEESVDDGVSETYWGEWKHDTRSGYGVCERSDGLKYVGQWKRNAKHGYGVTILKDGTREEGRYKNNVLVASIRRRNVLCLRSARIRELVEAAAHAAQRAATIATKKATIAENMSNIAMEKAEEAGDSAKKAHNEADFAYRQSSRFDPDYAASKVKQLALQGNFFPEEEGTEPMDQSGHFSQAKSVNFGSFEHLSFTLLDESSEDTPQTSF